MANPVETNRWDGTLKAGTPCDQEESTSYFDIKVLAASEGAPANYEDRKNLR